MIKNIRKRREIKKISGFFLVPLITVFIFLTLFSQSLHNHDILESEEYDCPLYLLSSQSLMSAGMVFFLILIFIQLLRELFEKRTAPAPIHILLPDNKGPPA